MEWKGSVALVTGASRGIGRAVAVAAARRGARVGLVARSGADLQAVLAQCGGDGAIAVGDAGDRASIEAACAEIEHALGPVDVLVNNAGIGDYASVLDADADVFERLMRVNYLGTAWATKAVLPGMVDRRRGHVVNVGSIAGRIGTPFEAAYAASKFAVTALTEALAIELTGTGVGVSLVNPGPVDTSFFQARGVPYQMRSPKPVPPEKVARAVIRAVARNRLETYVPAWLRAAHAFKTLVPPAYVMGTRRTFRDKLTR